MTTWAQIRDHYDRTWEAVEAKRGRKLTQVEVAETGGLKGQNAISKLRANRNLGPSVEVFVRAVLGLRVPLSEFFASLERKEPHARSGTTPTYQQLSESDLHALAVGRDLLRRVEELRPRRRTGK